MLFQIDTLASLLYKILLISLRRVGMRDMGPLGCYVVVDKIGTRVSRGAHIFGMLLVNG